MRNSHAIVIVRISVLLLRRGLPELVARLAQDLPEGYTYSWTGQTFQEQEAGGQFGQFIYEAGTMRPLTEARKQS